MNSEGQLAIGSYRYLGSRCHNNNPDGQQEAMNSKTKPDGQPDSRKAMNNEMDSQDGCFYLRNFYLATSSARRYN